LASSALTFGGPKRNRPFVTADTSVYALRVTVNGAGYPQPAGIESS